MFIPSPRQNKMSLEKRGHFWGACESTCHLNTSKSMFELLAYNVTRISFHSLLQVVLWKLITWQVNQTVFKTEISLPWKQGRRTHHCCWAKGGWGGPPRWLDPGRPRLCHLCRSLCCCLERSSVCCSLPCLCPSFSWTSLRALLSSFLVQNVIKAGYFPNNSTM